MEKKYLHRLLQNYYRYERAKYYNLKMTVHNQHYYMNN